MLSRDRSHESIAQREEVSFGRVIGAQEVDAAVLTGDRNPLHMDSEYAATTRFGERIAHGMLVASYFSALVGMYLPGRRTLLPSQEVKFVKPVRPSARISSFGDRAAAIQPTRLEETTWDYFGDILGLLSEAHSIRFNLACPA